MKIIEDMEKMAIERKEQINPYSCVYVIGMLILYFVQIVIMVQFIKQILS